MLAGMWRAALLLVTGCSFAFVRTPGPNSTIADCGDSAPLIDAAVAGAALAVAAALIIDARGCSGGDRGYEDSACFGKDLAVTYVGVPAAIGGVGFAASSIYGITTQARCRRVHRAR